MKIAVRRVFIVLLMLWAGGTVQGDDFHAINGFFGERASGLGGAFAAVSDDPSGAYYNPAGLAFADGASLSITASTYRITTKTFKSVLGPGQDYVLKAENFIPNFLGALTNLGSFKFAFSLISPATETFNQADQILRPLYIPAVGQVTAELTDQNTNVQLGPSLAWSLSPRFSMGATLYFFTDTSLETFSSTISQFDGTFVHQTSQDDRRTRGFIPILGLMYMPTDKTSLGLSLRTTRVASAKRRFSNYSTSGSSATTAASVFAAALSTQHRTAASTNIGIGAIGPGSSGKIPETSELRVGYAWFPNQHLMLTGDIIYTSGFDEKSDQTEYAPTLNTVVLNPPRDPFLHRRPTTNLALGLEYYVTDNLALRLGFFTNYSNNEEINQRETFISAVIAQNAGVGNFGAGVLFTQVNGVNVGYRVPELSERAREEWVNTFGLSLGVGWADANSSIGLNVVLERGGGRGVIVDALPAASLSYDSLFFYIVAATKR